MPQEDLPQHIRDAILGQDAAAIKAEYNRLRRSSPFLFCLLQDTLAEAAKPGHWPRVVERLAQAAVFRLESLANWQQDENLTVGAIRDGKIDPSLIRPHIRDDPSRYEAFYAGQSEKMSKLADQVSSENTSLPFIDVELPANVNHAFRHTHAISAVETLLGIIHAKESYRSAPLLWMDIGCGTGNFMNAVNPHRFGLERFEFVGCDMQAGKIALAGKKAAAGRTFVVADAFKMLSDFKSSGRAIDLVSMFEFLEHLDDPLRFLTELHAFDPTYVLAASPLEQIFHRGKDATPDRVHFWSFSRDGWIQMFKIAGFEPVYSSEVRVGDYIGGLDWLTVIFGPAGDWKKDRVSADDEDDDD